MKVNANLVGTPLKKYQAKINWRQTTNYAAAVQDNNPKFFDDRKKKGLVSHPMFAVSVTWPVLSRLGTFIESGDELSITRNVNGPFTPSCRYPCNYLP